MGVKRQQIQYELAFDEAGRGEAPRASVGGSETPKATKEPESQVSVERMMDAVVAKENVSRALDRVRKNKGAPGVDGMRTEELADFLLVHWPTIREELLRGTYQPQPVKRVEIPKPDGQGVRKLGIPTVVDRFVQQALLQVLRPLFDGTFSEHSYGFRPGRSAHQAVAAAQKHIEAGCGYVVDTDLEKFFDRVNHDMLMARMARRVKDKRVLRVLRAFLNAGVLENGLVSPAKEGTPQGGPLSPLLSNVMLDDLDKELEARGHRFVRYADDCNIYVRSSRAGERVKASITRFLTQRLKLKVNEAKSGVLPSHESTFLGFGFTSGSEPKRRISAKAVARLKNRVREWTSHRSHKSLSQMVRELGEYLRGWEAYYGFCETPSVLKSLDAWIRHRLRYWHWRKWSTWSGRYHALKRLGLPERQARSAAGSPRGAWHMSKSRPVHLALPDSYISSLGLPSLAPQTP